MISTILATLAPWLVVAVGAWFIFRRLKAIERNLSSVSAIIQRRQMKDHLTQFALEHGEGNPHDGKSDPKGKENRGLAASRINRDGLKAGTPAPAFRLPKLNGGELALEELRGRPLLLVFSDPQCGPCNALAPQLEELHQRTPHVQVVMISRQDEEANRKKVAEYGLTFPVVLQKQWEISRWYGIFATPVGYLIDENGVIVRDVATGAEAILGLLASPSQAKAA
jgi:peroxiredoxin